MKMLALIDWKFLDISINKRKLENNEQSLFLQVISRCKDLGGKEKQRLETSSIHYRGFWEFPADDFEQIRDLLEDCGYEFEFVRFE